MKLKLFMKTYPNAKKIVLCERCRDMCYGYYTLSYLTKGLYVLCPKHPHARPFIYDLPIPNVPSQHYLKHSQISMQGMGNAESG